MTQPKGRRGDWFANYGGELLPCIHKELMKGGLYHDNLPRGHKKHDTYVEALKRLKKALLTKNKPNPTGGNWLREGYLSVVWIDDVQYDDNGNLTFRFTGQFQSIGR